MVKKYVFISLGLSLLLRGIIFFTIYPDAEILTSSDQKNYVKLANHVSKNWNFDGNFGSARVPIYPVFLALCRLFSDNLFFPLAVQNIIGLASIYFIYKMGLLLSKRAAMIAGLLAALNLNFVISSNTMLTESIFYPVFCMFLLKLFQYVKNKNKADILVAGLLLGLCTLIRPVTIYMPVFIAPFILIQSRKSMSTKIIHTFMFFAFFLMVIAPWLYRNHTVFGTYKLTAQGEPHIIGWIIPSIMQNEEKIDLSKAMARSTQMWKQSTKKLPDDIRNDPFALDREAKKYFLQYLSTCSPMSIIRAWFWGSAKNFFSPVSIELAYMLKMDWTHFYETNGKGFVEQAWNFVFKNKNRTYGMMLISGILGVLFFRIIQVYGGWRLFNVDREMFFLGIIIILYFLIISGPVGYGKYRLPFEPVLILFTVLPFSEVIKRKNVLSESEERKPVMD